jgi:uncharacterized membrane protein YdbT with pleckstrin-like domain
MSYLQSILRRDENVLLISKLHWIHFANAFVGLIVTLVLASNHGSSAAFAYVMFALLAGLFTVASFISALISYLTTELAVTDRRVIFKRGLIRRDTIEQQLERVDSVSVSQSILGRMLDYGTVEIRGSGATFTPVHKIGKPLNFRRAVQYAIDVATGRNTQRTRS